MDVNLENLNLEVDDDDDDENQMHSNQGVPGGGYGEKKNLDDIQSLLNYGVDLKVIASVKNTNVEELKKMLQNGQVKVGQIPQPILHAHHAASMQANQQIINMNSIHPPSIHQLVDGMGGVMNLSNLNAVMNPQMLASNFVLPPVRSSNPSMNSQHGMGENLSKLDDKRKHSRKKSWKENEFPAENMGKFFCLDCSCPNRVRDCKCGRASWKWCDDCQKYQQPSYHYHFVNQRKKIRKKWKSIDFPAMKEGEKDMKYFCGDCKKPFRVLDCDCGRKCWKWCEECQSYKQSTNHKHFQKSRKMKRKRWSVKEFPTEKESKYYCLDCKKSNDTRKCSCGRDGWRWCDDCGKYLSKSHYHFKKRTRDDPEGMNTNTREENTQTMPNVVGGVIINVPQLPQQGNRGMRGNSNRNNQQQPTGLLQSPLNLLNPQSSAMEMEQQLLHLQQVNLENEQRMREQFSRGMMTHRPPPPNANLYNEIGEVIPMEVSMMHFGNDEEMDDLRPPQKKRKLD